MRDKERQRIHNPGRIAYPAKGEYGKQQRTTGKPAGLYYAFSRLCDRVRQCMEVPVAVRAECGGSFMLIYVICLILWDFRR